MNPETMAREVFDQATRLKATAAEFYHRREGLIRASVQGGDPESYSTRSQGAAGIRVFLGRKWGLAHTTDLSGEALRFTVKKALALAEIAEEDPHTRLLTSLKRSGPEDRVDPAIDSLDRDARFERALAIEKAAFATDKRVRSSRYVAFADRWGENFLSNTRGLQAGFREVEFHLGAMFGAGDDQAGQQLFGGQGSRRLATLSPESLGTSIAKRLVVTLGGKPLPTGVRDVVLDGSQTPDLLRYLAAALNGEQVHLGRSYLRERVGERIASPLFHLIDDPEALEGPGSRPWDDEGTPAVRKTLIRGGVLEGYLYGIVSASMAGTVSTGNGLRQEVGFPPLVVPTYFHMEPGGASLDALVSEVEKGLYVTGFMGRWADPVSGRISAAVLGAEIEGGRLTNPVAGVTLSGTLDSFLGSIDGIGSGLSGAGNFRGPALRIRRVQVSGA
ncbi:MAG: TldD/PmbA family protein [Planctomycetota bacterium]